MWLQLVAANKLQKGDVVPAAQLAGIMAAKQTANLIPLCHSLPLSQVSPHMCKPSGVQPRNLPQWVSSRQQWLPGRGRASGLGLVMCAGHSPNHD